MKTIVLAALFCVAATAAQAQTSTPFTTLDTPTGSITTFGDGTRIDQYGTPTGSVGTFTPAPVPRTRNSGTNSQPGVLGQPGLR